MLYDPRGKQLNVGNRHKMIPQLNKNQHMDNNYTTRGVRCIEYELASTEEFEAIIYIDKIKEIDVFMTT